MDSGEKRLRELGYKQELRRSLTALGNFGLCFSVISIMAGIMTTYNTGLAYGGPVAMVYGWFIVCFFTMCIATSMAEICSAYPTSGGLYFWSYKLAAGSRLGPFVAWLTGWFNIVGLWAGTTSVDFSCAQLLQVVILVATGGANGGGYYASKYVVICIYAGVLVIHGLLNSIPIKSVSWLAYVAALWNLIGSFVLMIILLAMSPARQTPSFAFSHFNMNTESGIDSRAYVFFLGLLMSQYTLLGYDSSAHMSEETKSADKFGAHGILAAVGCSVVLGFGVLLALVFTSVDANHLLNTSNDTKGYAVAQLFFDAFQFRFGDGRLAAVPLMVPCVAIFLCGLMAVTSTSRMTYAFSRDGALPFSSIWHRLDKREIPLNAVWLCVAIAFCMSLPYLGSAVAFQAMVSICTIALNISYVLPVLVRVTVARKTFVPGPFTIGPSAGIIVGWLAVVWVMIVSVLFCLPVVYPIKAETLNYTPVAMGGLLLLTVLYWLASARHWFRGPVNNIVQEV